MSSVLGQTYTSNVSKLLKHLDTLSDFQKDKIVPIMVHVSLTNVCNLKCNFCCFANRNKNEVLDFNKFKNAMSQFRELGTQAVENTGGGEPTLYPFINEAVDCCYDLGYSIGMCTNGTTLQKFSFWDKLKWVRVGMYCFDNNYKINFDHLRKFDVEVSSAYVWKNPNEDNFRRMVEYVNLNKIPTRIAVDAIRDVQLIQDDMNKVREILSSINGNEFAFLSDFNLKTNRRNNKCYMYMVKPFIFTDGNVYACPSSELSPENGFDMNEKFKICSIDDIKDFYSNQKSEPMFCNCSFCKYTQQNEIIEDLLMETKHNEFT